MISRSFGGQKSPICYAANHINTITNGSDLFDCENLKTKKNSSAKKLNFFARARNEIKMPLFNFIVAIPFVRLDSHGSGDDRRPSCIPLSFQVPSKRFNAFVLPVFLSSSFFVFLLSPRMKIVVFITRCHDHDAGRVASAHSIHSIHSSAIL